MKISRVQIDFPLPVALPEHWERGLCALTDEVCSQYEAEHPDRIMWPAGIGSLITHLPMTRADEEERGIEFDDSVFAIEVAAREAYAPEIERRRQEQKRRLLRLAQAADRRAVEFGRLAQVQDELRGCINALRDLELTAIMLETWAPEAFPAAPGEKIHFARALMESAAQAIRMSFAEAIGAAERAGYGGRAMQAADLGIEE